MAHLRLSLGNAIFTILVFTSYVTGITGTVESNAELAACSLADVAHTCRLDVAIPSGNPEWYHEGMQMFCQEGVIYWYWNKENITWALMNDPKVMTSQYVIQAFQDAFDKWEAVSGLTFTRVSPTHQPKPDIRVEFRPRDECHFIMQMIHNKKQWVKDHEGVTIRVRITNIWVDRSLENWRNFRFFALYEVGHVLGVPDSYDPRAIMYRYGEEAHPMETSTKEYGLAKDDIREIQRLYGRPSSNRFRGYRERQPSPSSSSTSTSSSSDDDDSD